MTTELGNASARRPVEAPGAERMADSGRAPLESSTQRTVDPVPVIRGAVAPASHGLPLTLEPGDCYDASNALALSTLEC